VTVDLGGWLAEGLTTAFFGFFFSLPRLSRLPMNDSSPSSDAGFVLFVSRWRLRPVCLSPVSRVGRLAETVCPKIMRPKIASLTMVPPKIIAPETMP
jgi:hypothetical protein